jgi:hypothetical protein
MLIDAPPRLGLHVVPFETWHYVQAWSVCRPLATAAGPWDDPRLVGRGLGTTGQAYTLLDGDEVYLVAGVAVPAWPGVGAAWALLTPAGRAFPFHVHRAVVRHLARIVDELALRRLEATVYGEEPRLHRWARALGLIAEGARPLAGPQGETGYTYARTWETP